MQLVVPCLRNYARFENKASALNELWLILLLFDSNEDKELEGQPFEANR